jgi:FkbM family methyltransferase
MKLDLGGPYRIARTGLGDHILYNPHDAYIGRSLDLYGEFSGAELRFLLSGLGADDVVIDVGANIGAFTVPIARKVHHVLAIEPQRLLFQMLCANLALNGLTNVRALPNCAGEVAGRQVRVPVLDPRAAQNFGGVSVGGDGETVSEVRLDDLGFGRVDLVKIDVEGAERSVLLGARQMIADLKPMLYVENDRPDRSADLIRTIVDMGYRAYWHLPPLFSPRNPAGNPDNVFGRTVSVNMICWHESRLPPVVGDIARRRVTGPDDSWRRLYDAAPE